MHAFLTEFGLSPASRTRVRRIPPKENPMARRNFWSNLGKWQLYTRAKRAIGSGGVSMGSGGITLGGGCF